MLNFYYLSMSKIKAKVMKTNPDKALLDAMWKNPNNWKGILYVNGKDPRLFVPKLNPSLGWTLNLGNRITYYSIAGLILMAIIYSYFW